MIILQMLMLFRIYVAYAMGIRNDAFMIQPITGYLKLTYFLIWFVHSRLSETIIVAVKKLLFIIWFCTFENIIDIPEDLISCKCFMKYCKEMKN